MDKLFPMTVVRSFSIRLFDSNGRVESGKSDLEGRDCVIPSRKSSTSFSFLKMAGKPGVSEEEAVAMIGKRFDSDR